MVNWELKNCCNGDHKTFLITGNYLINYLATRGPELQPFVHGLSKDAKEKLAPYSALSGDESYSNRDVEKGLKDFQFESIIFLKSL
ncbi:hypothetical protein Scep_004129 [Stephania cephalantha]|uniref:Uncharacterized protein n=1 Tax=Stephania cephalantha TaxID=152367 RepID=A0AAP0PWE0_9MAGN